MPEKFRWRAIDRYFSGSWTTLDRRPKKIELDHDAITFNGRTVLMVEYHFADDTYFTYCIYGVEDV